MRWTLLIKAFINTKKFGEFVADNWKGFAIVILIVSIGAYHTRHINQIQSLNDTITELRDQLAKEKQKVAKCHGALNTQNVIIDAVSQAGNQILAEERERAAKLAKENREVFAAHITNIINRPVAVDCAGAIRELVDAPKGDLKW